MQLKQKLFDNRILKRDGGKNYYQRGKRPRKREKCS